MENEVECVASLSNIRVGNWESNTKWRQHIRGGESFFRLTEQTTLQRGVSFFLQDIYQKYLDAGVATRVHFNSYPRDSLTRHGYSSNDCLYRAKNHARWLIANIDVDEYLVPSFQGHVWYVCLKQYVVFAESPRPKVSHFVMY